MLYNGQTRQKVAVNPDISLFPVLKEGNNQPYVDSHDIRILIFILNELRYQTNQNYYLSGNLASMNKIRYCFSILTCFIFPGLYGQVTPVEKGLEAITKDVIKAQLGFLASDWTEGREAGERGEYLAADYIASMLHLYGVKPAGDNLTGTAVRNTLPEEGRSFFQNFVLLKTVPGEEQSLELISRSGNEVETTTFANNVDFTIRPQLRSVQVEAPVVFAGYGFMNEKIKYNDFSRLDIKGKFILKISGYPAFTEKRLNPSEINTSAAAAEKYAKEMGAAGILEFDPEESVVGKPAVREFMNQSPAERIRETARSPARYSLPGKIFPDEMLRITISVKAANEILKGSGIKIDDFLKTADSDQSVVIPSLSGKSVRFKSEATTTQVAVRNIIGVIEGIKSDQKIVIGAHYDHVGIRNGYIWNGADDNASGTVGVLTLAKAITATGEKPEKTIIIALWSAEEKGLLGSRHYVRNLTYPQKNLRLNVNFDMISRYISDENKKGVEMTYTSSQAHFKDLTERNLKKYGIDLIVDYNPSDNPPGGSDHRSFVEAGVPVMKFKPGHREEYHTPYDEAGTLDWEIMEKIIRISFVNIWELANSNW